MPSAANPIGIKSVSYTLCQTFEKTKKLGAVTPLFDKDGKFVENDGRDPMFEFSMNGLGDLPAGLVAGSVAPAVTGIVGGKSIIKDADEGDKNDNWNDWNVSGENWPAA